MALTEAEEALAAAEIALTEVKEFMVADSVAGNVALRICHSSVLGPSILVHFNPPLD